MCSVRWLKSFPGSNGRTRRLATWTLAVICWVGNGRFAEFDATALRTLTNQVLRLSIGGPFGMAGSADRRLNHRDTPLFQLKLSSG
jgi:hypothetical protein